MAFITQQKNPTSGAWKKFAPPPTPMEIEKKLKDILPTEKDAKRIMDNTLDTMIKASQSETQKWAYEVFKANLNAEDIQSKTNEDFAIEFFKFCLGTSKFNYPADAEKQTFGPNGKNKGFKLTEGDSFNASNASRTPWGNEPLTYLPEVKEFVDSVVDSRFSVMKYVTLLKQRGPKTLFDVLFWFKYITQQGIIDHSMINYLRFLEPYDFIPPSKIPHNVEADGTPSDPKESYPYYVQDKLSGKWKYVGSSATIQGYDADKGGRVYNEDLEKEVDKGYVVPDPTKVVPFDIGGNATIPRYSPEYYNSLTAHVSTEIGTAIDNYVIHDDPHELFFGISDIVKHNEWYLSSEQLEQFDAFMRTRIETDLKLSKKQKNALLQKLGYTTDANGFHQWELEKIIASILNEQRNNVGGEPEEEYSYYTPEGSSKESSKKSKSEKGENDEGAPNRPPPPIPETPPPPIPEKNKAQNGNPPPLPETPPPELKPMDQIDKEINAEREKAAEAASGNPGHDPNAPQDPGPPTSGVSKEVQAELDQLLGQLGLVQLNDQIAKFSALSNKSESVFISNKGKEGLRALQNSLQSKMEKLNELKEKYDQSNVLKLKYSSLRRTKRVLDNLNAKMETKRVHRQEKFLAKYNDPESAFSLTGDSIGDKKIMRKFFSIFDEEDIQNRGLGRTIEEYKNDVASSKGNVQDLSKTLQSQERNLYRRLVLKRLATGAKIEIDKNGQISYKQKDGTRQATLKGDTKSRLENWLGYEQKRYENLDLEKRFGVSLPIYKKLTTFSIQRTIAQGFHKIKDQEKLSEYFNSPQFSSDVSNQLAHYIMDNQMYLEGKEEAKNIRDQFVEMVRKGDEKNEPGAFTNFFERYVQNKANFFPKTRAIVEAERLTDIVSGNMINLDNPRDPVDNPIPPPSDKFKKAMKAEYLRRLQAAEAELLREQKNIQGTIFGINRFLEQMTTDPDLQSGMVTSGLQKELREMRKVTSRLGDAIFMAGGMNVEYLKQQTKKDTSFRDLVYQIEAMKAAASECAMDVNGQKKVMNYHGMNTGKVLNPAKSVMEGLKDLPLGHEERIKNPMSGYLDRKTAAVQKFQQLYAATYKYLEDFENQKRTAQMAKTMGDMTKTLQKEMDKRRAQMNQSDDEDEDY